MAGEDFRFEVWWQDARIGGNTDIGAATLGRLFVGRCGEKEQRRQRRWGSIIGLLSELLEAQAD